MAAGTAQGIIGSPGDKDVYRFTAGLGSLTASVTPAARSPNADLVLTLISDTGMVLASSNPQNALNASITYQIFRAGTYYLQVSGTGQGNPATDGYSDYGSLGNYQPRRQLCGLCRHAARGRADRDPRQRPCPARRAHGRQRLA